MRAQLVAQQKAARAQLEAQQRVVEAAKEEAATAQRHREEAIDHYRAQFAKLQSGTLILRRMEATREQQNAEERKLGRTILERLQQHTEELDEDARRQRAELEQELDKARGDAEERMSALAQQLDEVRRSHADAPSAAQLLELQQHMERAAGAGGSGTAGDRDAHVHRESKRLEAENQRLRSDANTLRAQLQSKEKEHMKEIEEIRR